MRQVYGLFGTLAVRLYHITHGVFDVGPNFIQVLSYTIRHKPCIPLKSAGSKTVVEMLIRISELTNSYINQNTNSLD